MVGCCVLLSCHCGNTTCQLVKHKELPVCVLQAEAWQKSLEQARQAVGAMNEAGQLLANIVRTHKLQSQKVRQYNAPQHAQVAGLSALDSVCPQQLCKS